MPAIARKVPARAPVKPPVKPPAPPLTTRAPTAAVKDRIARSAPQAPSPAATALEAGSAPVAPPKPVPVARERVPSPPPRVPPRKPPAVPEPPPIAAPRLPARPSPVVPEPAGASAPPIPAAPAAPVTLPGRPAAQSTIPADEAPKFADARVSSLLSGKPIYRMRDGRLVELPEDMTAEEAARLEADAEAALKKLGKGPPPRPVPDVREPADRSEKKGAAKAKGKGGRAARRGRGGPRTAAATARVKAVGGAVAQYLAGKAAPVLAKGISALRTLSRNEQTHADAGQKVQQAEMAVVIPATEGQSKSNAAQVGEVGARPAPPVDPARAKLRLTESLAENVPRTIEDVDNFKRDKKAQHMGTDVMQVVQGDKNAVVGTFSDMERTPPAAPPEHAPEALPPPEPAPATGPLNLGRNAVAPLLPEHTFLGKFTSQADTRLREEGITQEQLDMVDSGDLAAAKKEKKGMEQAAKTEPQAIEKFSQQQGAKVDTELKQEEKLGRGKVSARRRDRLVGASQKQKQAKSALEKKRDEVAAKINGMHKAVQARVKKKLADLETKAMKRFDDGNDAATRAFEDNVNREIEAFKDDRYSGMFGWARKARDWLLGIDDLPAVKAIFDRNRATFVATIERLVAAISADNKRVIQECKDDLAKTKADIKEYVDGLGPALKGIGKKTAGDVNRQLEELDGFVRKQEEELQSKLADKQQAAIKAIDEKIEKMKEAMSGALAKLGKLLLWAAKKLFTWALSQFGYSLGEIEGIISKGAAVLKAIFTKPIVFVKNLMSAAITGFRNFGKNFLKHLKDALFEWLTGSLEGITLPKTWDLQGIVGLALQMIGVSYQNMRRHMVAVMGEPVVEGLEKGFALVKTLVTQGPMAAWEQLQEMARDMRDAFVDAVKDFIKMKIVEQAIQWVVSLFIPGAGLVKAVIGIYDTVVFFIRKAKQIARMIANFLGSIGEIAAGNIGAAAAAMEAGLARGLSLVISFLAALLRLNGITAKIREAIQKVRSKVDAALLKVATWIADKAKKLFGVVKTGVKAGAKAVVSIVASWWKREKKFTVDGEPHRLFYGGGPKKAQLRVASDEKSLEDFVREASAAGGADKKAVNAVTKAQNEVNRLRELRKPPTPDAADPKIDPLIDAQFEIIADNLPKLFSGDAWGTDTNPVLLAHPKKALSLYRTLYLGPRVEGRLKQSDLQSVAGKKATKAAPGFDKTKPIQPTKPALDAWVANGGVVKAYRPFEQASWPDGATHASSGTLGVAPQFQAQVGTSFTYEKGSTPGGKKLNAELKKFGYHGRKDGGENSDGDHILEAQLVGRSNADQIPNMWPLDKTENRHGLKLETAADVEVAGRATLRFKGLLGAVDSKDPRKTKRKGGLRLIIKKTVESQ